MDVVVAVIFVVALMLVVYFALQPGLEALLLDEQQRRTNEAKVVEIQMAGKMARGQVDEIMTRYGRLMDQVVEKNQPHHPESLEVLIFSENEF